MATIIAEPADLPVDEITTLGAERFRILVYKMAQDDAGIKTLGLADWKTFLAYNGVAVDNVATYVGIDVNEYNYKSTTPVPIGNVVDVVTRINNLATNSGLPWNTTQSGTPNLVQRTASLEGYVKDGYTEGETHYDGLLDRVTDLESSVGPGGGGGGSDTLSSRVSALETTVGDSNSGLVKDVDDLQTDIGTYDISKGTVEERLTYLKTKVGDDGSGGTEKSGLIEQTDNLETKTGCGSAYTDTNSLVARLSILETNTGVGLAPNDPANPYDNSKNLEQRIEEVESAAGAAYHYVGTIISVVNDSVTEPTVTVTLNLDGGRTVTLADLNASNVGEVYNIKPNGEAEYLEIIWPTNNKMKLQDGANIAWVWSETDSSGHFDELGGSIDVQAINEHLSTLDGAVATINTSLSSDEERLEDLESKFKNNGVLPTTKWSSRTANLNGVFLVAGYKPTVAGAAEMESFIGFFTNGVCFPRNDIHVSSPSTVFDFNDGATSPTYVVETLNDNIRVFITQLG